jgi:hypothetical protein
MAETSLLWVDHLLPQVRYRQFVLSFDGPMAVRLGYDSALLGKVCRAFAHRLSQSLRRRVRQHHCRKTVARLHPGIVTVVQRFRSDLGLYVHLHCLVTDGAFEDPDDPDLHPIFFPAPELQDEDLVAILERLSRDLDADDEVPDVDEGIAACVQLALSTPAATTPIATPATHLNVHALGSGRPRTAAHRRPRPPTDPDVQISRIRLLDSRLRCSTIDGLDDLRLRERIPLKQPIESFPGHLCTL